MNKHSPPPQITINLNFLYIAEGKQRKKFLRIQKLINVNSLFNKDVDPGKKFLITSSVTLGAEADLNKK